MKNNIRSRSSRNDHIEILRAVAVLFILVLHVQVIPLYFSYAEFMPYVYSNFSLAVGVDLFLVISGFVITQSLIRSLQGSSEKHIKVILSFWVRRIFRLLPSAWLWLLIVLIYQIWQYTLIGSFEEFWKELLAIGAALLNVMNVYGGICPPESLVEWCSPTDAIHGHYWSLSLEEQFYLVFPILFFFVSRKFFISLLIFAVSIQLFWTRPFFTPFFYFKTDALCWGVLIALASYTEGYAILKKFFCRYEYFAAFLLIIGVVALPVVADRVWGVFTMRSYGISLIAIIGGLVVLLASIEFWPINPNSSWVKVFLYFGSRSYGIYIIHLIVFFIVGRFGAIYDPGFIEPASQYFFDWVLVIGSVGLTLFLAELNYRYVERPWREKGRVISGRMLAVEKAVSQP